MFLPTEVWELLERLPGHHSFTEIHLETPVHAAPEPRKRVRRSGLVRLVEQIAELKMGERRQFAVDLANKYPEEYQHLVRSLADAAPKAPQKPV